MLNRRSLLASVGGLVLAGCAARATTATSPPPPTGSLPDAVPATGWNGTAGSGYGGSEPVATPNRAATDAALPAVQWHTSDGDRWIANGVIGFDAYANGGIKLAELLVEGNVYQATESVYQDKDANGNTRYRVGYWFTFDCLAALTAHAAGGKLHVYARVTPQKAGFAQRILGPLTIYAQPPGPNNGFAKQYFVTPSAGSNTVTASGGTFTSLTAVRAQYLLDTPSSAEVIFTETQTVNLPPYYYAGGGFFGYNGRVVFRCINTNTVATLKTSNNFVASPDAANPWTNEWGWMPFCAAIHFQGSGIQFDMANWYRLYCMQQDGQNFGHVFDGCQFYNSQGRDTLYWNGQPPPPFQALQSGGQFAPSDFINCTSRNCYWGFAGRQVSGCNQIGSMGNHDMCGFIVNHYETGSNPGFFSNLNVPFTIYYTGAGTAQWVVNSQTIDIQVNGASIGGNFPITLQNAGQGFGQYGQPTTDPYFSISSIVSSINSHAGFHATATDTTRSSQCLTGANSPVSISSSAGSPTSINGAFPNHTEWQHFIGPMQNTIFRNCVVTNSWWTTDALSFGAGGFDCAVLNCVWTESTLSLGTGGINGDHIVMLNCVYPSSLQISDMGGSRSLVAYNIINGISGSVILTTAGPVVRDNAIVNGYGTINAATKLASGSGNNVTIPDYATFLTWSQGLYVTPVDPRPAGPALLSLNLRPQPENPWDMLCKARAASDTMGPYRLADGALATWPS